MKHVNQKLCHVCDDTIMTVFDISYTGKTDKDFSYFQRWISYTQITTSRECYHFNCDVWQYSNIIVETLKFCVFTRPDILAPAKQWYKPTQKSLTFKNQEKNLSCIIPLTRRFCKDVFPFHFSRVLLGLGDKKGREESEFIQWHWIWTTHKQGLLLN